MRIMAIDYGDARTGVAISDPTGLLAGYTTVIQSRKEGVVAEELARLAKEHSVDELVMGFPRNMDGTEGPRAELYRAFAARLGLPAPAPELPLTDRDRELARLVAGRCANKEIAAALYLSEGTVKQYINQLYAKLDMGGDPRTRRARLAEWYQKNAPRN